MSGDVESNRIDRVVALAHTCPDRYYLHEAARQEVVELGRPVKPLALVPAALAEPRRRLARDEEDGAHRVHVVVRGRALRHLDGGDAQGPDVGLAIVAEGRWGEGDRWASVGACDVRALPLPYLISWITSGAIQKGVPTTVYFGWGDQERINNENHVHPDS